MRKWKLAGVLALAIITGGCTQPVREPEQSVAKEAHLPWPTPLQVCKFKFEFIGDGKSAYVKIPYQDWITLSKCRETELNYISNLTALTCSYRVYLNEYRCNIFGKENK